MKEVHVAYTRLDLSDEYTPYMAASMESVMKNTTDKVMFHIIYEACKCKDKREEIINKLNELVGKNEILYHHFKLPADLMGEGAWSRLYLTEILKNVDRVILLGGDVIVKTDLSKLINTIPESIPLQERLIMEFITNTINLRS